MYTCSKCGAEGHKKRLEIVNDEGERFSPSMGDIICEKYGYSGSKSVFEDKKDSVENEK